MGLIDKSGDDGFTRRQEDKLDWKTAAPRWLLLVALMVSMGVIGRLSSRLDGSTAREQARLEAAIADSPTKYQARLSERVAVVEEQYASLRKSMDGFTVELKNGSAATSTLTTEMKLLNAAVERLNATVERMNENRRRAEGGGK